MTNLTLSIQIRSYFDEIKIERPKDTALVEDGEIEDEGRDGGPDGERDPGGDDGGGPNGPGDDELDDEGQRFTPMFDR